MAHKRFDSTAERMRAYRRRAAADREQANANHFLIEQLHYAVRGAVKCGSLPSELYCLESSQQTARNLIDHLSGQQCLFELENTTGRAPERTARIR